jgi:hypothetical protein
MKFGQHISNWLILCERSALLKADVVINGKALIQLFDVGVIVYERFNL